jgi:sugar lactone lactonase YvrE
MTRSATPALLTLEDGRVYEWSEPWAEWLAERGPEDGREWIHSGLAVSRTGDLVVTGHHGAEAFLLAPDGTVRHRFPTGLTQAHGITVVVEGDDEVLWVADNGSRRHCGPDGAHRHVDGSTPPRVVKMSLDGEHLLSITAADLGVAVPPPESTAYRTGSFSPTTVAVDEEALGGSGDVWIADGYGAHCVHRFTRDGTYAATLTGEEGAGRFDIPHAVWVDRRRAEPELYVSDSMNRRIQVYGLDGGFRRVVGGDVGFRPITGFARDGSHLIVSELLARVTVLDGDDRVVGSLGDDADAPARPGFPNRLDEAGRSVRPHLRPGLFNSPHGIAADAAGNLYLNEYVVGSRLVKLTKRSAESVAI